MKYVRLSESRAAGGNFFFGFGAATNEISLSTLQLTLLSHSTVHTALALVYNSHISNSHKVTTTSGQETDIYLVFPYIFGKTNQHMCTMC